MRVARWLAACVAVLLVCPAFAATVNAASCSQANVQSAINSAVDGDTVTVPAGTCTWSASVNLTNKNVTLQGAGSSSTIINHGGGQYTLLVVNTNKTGKVDISGFRFVGKPATEYWNGIAIEFWGPTGWKNLRIHHNEFVGNDRWTMRGSTATHGLIDHNTFSGSAAGILFSGLGKKDWSTPLKLGSADFFFLEDNTFAWNDWNGVIGAASLDMDDGGRAVFRYNSLTYGFVETHDKARSGLVSAAAYEIYGNTFAAPSGNKWKAIDMSSGTGVIWGNTITGDWTVPIGAIDYKTSDPRSVLVCDGNDPADQNVPGQTGWRCQYQIGSMGEGPAAYGFPLYLWSNTHNGSPVGMSCTDGCTHVVAGRDFINNGTTAKPGYTPYQYPHPLNVP